MGCDVSQSDRCHWRIFQSTAKDRDLGISSDAGRLFDPAGALRCADFDRGLRSWIFLPVFGTGTVLWPWAVIKVLGGDFKMAIGLLIIWGVGQLLRQLIQPKIVGDSIGVPPLSDPVSDLYRL